MEKKRDFCKIFRDPILRPIEVIATLLALFFIWFEFTESNRLTWLNSINASSLELSKMEIEHDYITCLYESKESVIVKNHTGTSDNCANGVYDKMINIKKATLYLEENLGFFIDVIEYDKEHGENEFLDYYKGWYKDLHIDNKLANEFQTKAIKGKIKYINNYLDVPK